MDCAMFFTRGEKWVPLKEVARRLQLNNLRGVFKNFTPTDKLYYEPLPGGEKFIRPEELKGFKPPWFWENLALSKKDAAAATGVSEEDYKVI